RQRLASKYLGCVLVALRREARRLARRALEQPPREAPRGQRAARRTRDPLLDEIAPRRERVCETVAARARSERELEHERDPRAHLRPREPLAGAERHARGDRCEELGAAVVGVGRDATPDLALFGSLRERRRDLIKGNGCRLRREPVEVV